MIIPWQPMQVLPDGVVVSCNCLTEDNFGEPIPAHRGLKKVSLNDVNKTVRRRCKHCKTRWKIKVTEDVKGLHVKKLGYIAERERVF